MNNFNFKNDIICQIKHLSKLIETDNDKRVSELGLTSAQARVLFFIIRRSQNNIEVHQKDVESEFRLAKSSVNGLISRLLKTGYIAKVDKHPYVILVPTESGQAAANKIRQGRAETVNKLFTGYSEEQKLEIINVLNTLIDNLEGDENDEKRK